jgi:hypothetical protein
VSRRSFKSLPGIFVLLAAALLLGSEAPSTPLPPAPLVGFSYSPMFSQWIESNPNSDLRELLAATNPDLVRLPIYLDDVEPTPGYLDYSSVDQLLGVVAEHNATSSRPTRVILTIGARNFMYPELHTPLWAGPRQQPSLGIIQAGDAYRLYFDASLQRYASSPLLYAWQVENEAFDYVVNQSTGDDQISPEQMAWEVGEAHRLDPSHRVVTTTFDGWNVLVDWFQQTAPSLATMHGYSGHPGATLAAGDALGLDIYLDGPSTPYSFTSIALRTSLKAEAIRYWAGLAKAQNKEVWLTEMQAQPWSDVAGSFGTNDLLDSAATYRHEPLSVVLLWGAETWLLNPEWMNAAVSALAILRAP